MFKIRIAMLNLFSFPFLFGHFSFRKAFENAQLQKYVSYTHFFLYLAVVVHQNLLIVILS